MKLFGLLATAAVASDSKWDQVGKRGGKHGRTEMGSKDRLILHHPICMTNPDHPNCNKDCQKTFTDFSGEIKIDGYDSYTSCLWQISLPPTRTLTFQFVGDFDLEYHHKCGYDRVHIFSGSMDGETQRQGRFCGPKGKDNFPYDGSKRNVPSNGHMNFFSDAFDIRNNNAVVGFDADQSFVGGGFTLIWNSHKMYDYDFTDVYESHEFVTTTAKFLFNSVMFETDKLKKKYQKQLEGRITAKSLAALSNNPGSNGGKRRCAKSDQLGVSNKTVQAMKDLADNENADFADAMDALQSLIDEFLGNCRVGGEKWPQRTSAFAQDVEQTRRL
jgi:hypothetical protein